MRFAVSYKIFQLTVMSRLQRDFASGAQGDGNKSAAERLVFSDGSDRFARNVNGLTYAEKIAGGNGDAGGVDNDGHPTTLRERCDADNDHHEAEKAKDSWDKASVKADRNRRGKADEADERASEDHRDGYINASLERHGLTRHKISDRARERVRPNVRRTNWTKATHQSGARFAASLG